MSSLLLVSVGCYILATFDMAKDMAVILREIKSRGLQEVNSQDTPEDINDIWSEVDLESTKGTTTPFKIENKYADISQVPSESPNLVQTISKDQVYLTVDSEEPDIKPLVYDERDGDEYEYVKTAIQSAEVVKGSKSRRKGYGRAYTPFNIQGYYTLVNTPEYMLSSTPQINGTSVVDWSTPQTVYFGGFGDDSERVKEVTVSINTSYFYEADYMREMSKLQSISRTYSGTDENDELKDNLLTPIDIEEKGKTVYIQSTDSGVLQGLYIPFSDNRIVHLYLRGEELPYRRDIVHALVSLVGTSDIVVSSDYLGTDAKTVLGKRETSKGTDINGFYKPTNEWLKELLSLESEGLSVDTRLLESSSNLTAIGIDTSDKVLLGTGSDSIEKQIQVDGKVLRVLSAYHYTNPDAFEDPYEVLARNNIRKAIPLYYKSYILESGERLLVGIDQLTDAILFGWLLGKDEVECTSIYFGDREGLLYEVEGNNHTSYLLNNKEDLELLVNLLRKGTL